MKIKSIDDHLENSANSYNPRKSSRIAIIGAGVGLALGIAAGIAGGESMYNHKTLEQTHPPIHSCVRYGVDGLLATFIGLQGLILGALFAQVPECYRHL